MAPPREAGRGIVEVRTFGHSAQQAYEVVPRVRLRG